MVKIASKAFINTELKTDKLGPNNVKYAVRQQSGTFKRHAMILGLRWDSVIL